MLAHLSRDTHCVAISNSQLISLDERGVTFRWKDYRFKGRTRYQTMALPAEEFMRQFLLHVLPPGFHRIRHQGLLANGNRTSSLALARQLLRAQEETNDSAMPLDEDGSVAPPVFVWRHCGHTMIVLQILGLG